MSIKCHCNVTQPFIIFNKKRLSPHCHSTVTQMLNVTQTSLKCHSDATRVPLECHLDVTRMSLEGHSDVTRMSLGCHPEEKLGKGKWNHWTKRTNTTWIFYKAQSTLTMSIPWSWTWFLLDQKLGSSWPICNILDPWKYANWQCVILGEIHL